MGVRYIWGISVPSAQYFCEPKTILKNSLYTDKQTNR